MGEGLGKRLLLTDDDAGLRHDLAEQLGLLESFQCWQAGSAHEALHASRHDGPFDAMILDVGLPDMDGRDLCRLLRREGVKCPIIMLTGAASDADQILGLESGANDYVAKPFRLNVLLARLRAQLRQFEASDDALFSLGPYSFNPAAKFLTHGRSGKKVRLTEKETQILKHLYRAGSKTVSRDDLLVDVWGYRADIATHTLETHIYRLRQKLEAGGGEARLLVTEPGGYRLAAES
jgi:DNA-binding response OmpR family regulator